jgi:pilus assembly protein CpaB
MKQKLLLLSAVFFGVLAFVFTYNQIQYERDKALGAARFVELVEMKRTMTAGEKIKETDITRKKIKRLISYKSDIREVTWKNRNLIIDQELAYEVKAGHFLTWNDLKASQSRGSGLAKLVKAPFRAISISVDATSSVTGLIKPLDHVDIIGTFRFPDMKGDKGFDTITMTILQDVKILATGTDMGLSRTGNAPRNRKGYSTVTLSLTPKEVEMIIFASQKGRLTLSLRNFEDTRMEDDLQSVNFNYLQKNLKKYMDERKKLKY